MLTTPVPISASSDRTASGFEHECIELFGELVQVFGIAPSVGQIYGLLFASPEPLSFSDIVTRLGISKGSASQGLGLLRNLGAIAVVPWEGGKIGIREYFQAELSLRKLVSGVLQEQIAPATRGGAGRLARLRQFAEEEAGENREFMVDRVRQLERWRRRFNTALPLLVAVLGPRRKS